MTTSRPTLITIVCMLGFLGAVLIMVASFTGVAKAIGAWYPVFSVAMGVALLIAYGAIWKMKKWGVWLYVVILVLSNIVLFAAGTWSISALILPLLFVAIFYSKYKLMS